MFDGALADLEGAYVLDAAEVGPSLISGLTRRRDAARVAGEADHERATTLRLVEVLSNTDRRDEARAALGEWIERDRKDSAALALMVELDRMDERWEAVAKSCGRLVAIEQGEAQVAAALQLAHACRELGRPEDARAGLEHARRKQPSSPEIRDALRGIYEQVGADKELARLLAAQAEETTDPEAKLALLQRASELLVAQGEGEAALPLVRAVVELRPGDFTAQLVLVDALLTAYEIDEAAGVLDAALADPKGKRPHELAALHHRRARIAGARGQHDEQLNELQAAFGHDKNNGDIAAELADLAEALEQWDLAVRVLRTITLIDGECPISRTSAFLRQAKIAHRRGDRQRAVLWARKAKHEGPDSTEVAEFLTELGEA
jgi:tetratricopeptide (TPR) repeat protein